MSSEEPWRQFWTSPKVLSCLRYIRKNLKYVWRSLGLSWMYQTDSVWNMSGRVWNTFGEVFNCLRCMDKCLKHAWKSCKEVSWKCLKQVLKNPTKSLFSFSSLSWHHVKYTQLWFGPLFLSSAGTHIIMEQIWTLLEVITQSVFLFSVCWWGKMKYVNFHVKISKFYCP